MRAFLLFVLSVVCAALLFASCKSNDIASSNTNSNTTNVGLPCNPDAGAAGNQCGTGVCVAGFCRARCTSDLECGGVGGTGGVCLTYNGVSGCRLESETQCGGGHPACPPEFVCGTDASCHTKCIGGVACPLNDETCNTHDGVCYGPSVIGDSGGGSSGGGQDATTPLSDGGSGSSSGSSGGGSSSGSGSGGLTDGNACLSAQTQFGFTATGDTNPSFTSGVGVRTASQLLIFSGYYGPDPSNDAGGNVNDIYVQAFDPITARAAGPAHYLFRTITPDITLGIPSGIVVYSAFAAPTGEIALLFKVTFYQTGGGAASVNSLTAAFLSAPDAGADPMVSQIVQLETAPVFAQPHVIWAPPNNAFAFSWTYQNGGLEFAKVKKFLPDGRAAGGDTDVVPTDYADDRVSHYGQEMGSVGVSGNQFGVAYLSDQGAPPFLTVLNSTGTQVGTAVELSPQVSMPWVTGGGAAQGFVTFFGSAPVTEVFVPTLAGGGVVTYASDAGDAGAYSSFTFPGATGASTARAISDGVGGAGGVGVALLYANGVSFAYVNADGMTHTVPTSVISYTSGDPTSAQGDKISLSNFGGSFGLSAYISAQHLTKMAASGCR